MNIEIYNDWYVRTDGRIGPWTITTTQQASAEQIHNAYKIYSALLNDGWTLNAISATLGNMQHESSLDPALIEESNRWRLPNRAANLSDVPNSVMQNHYKEYYTGIHGSGGYGLGLTQWDGKGITRQKLVGYCENNGWVWYDGDAQIQRIFYEKTNDMQWQTYRLWGVDWEWSNYVVSTLSPEKLADVWNRCYEVSGGYEEREANARFWYDYFNDNPDPPGPGPGPGPGPEPEPIDAPTLCLLTANKRKSVVGRSRKRMIYY